MEPLVHLACFQELVDAGGGGGPKVLGCKPLLPQWAAAQQLVANGIGLWGTLAPNRL